ncbi:hypothetical protein INR49_015538 [Caranx melampygus]|nr:hypothetical protein INR49_015538 [Caranx melampygus]
MGARACARALAGGRIRPHQKAEEPPASHFWYNRESKESLLWLLSVSLMLRFSIPESEILLVRLWLRLLLEEAVMKCVLDAVDCLLMMESLKEDSLMEEEEMHSFRGVGDRNQRQGNFSARVILARVVDFTLTQKTLRCSATVALKHKSGLVSKENALFSMLPHTFQLTVLNPILSFTPNCSGPEWFPFARPNSTAPRATVESEFYISVHKVYSQEVSAACIIAVKQHPVGHRWPKRQFELGEGQITLRGLRPGNDSV